jgi:hypothetical protein
MPPPASRALYRRYLGAIRRRACEDQTQDGSFALGWALTIITAVR